mgnify:CR=1 FL=1
MDIEIDFFVLPAYAGMIPREKGTPMTAKRAPRVCGDDPAPAPAGAFPCPCSPRMRG